MIESLVIYIAPEIKEPDRGFALNLKQALDLESTSDNEPSDSKRAVFEYADGILCLHLLLDNKPTSLSFDFDDGEVGYRARRVSKSNELVARALGVKPNYRPKVLDATAGMGRDSLIMAMLGCNVVMYERQVAIHALLANALERFKLSGHNQQVAERLFLAQNDSKEFVKGAEGFDVIYLDPMFPERKKSALVKKEMRLFKMLAGEDKDADELLLGALQSPVPRIVVKRPKGAPVLANKKPSHEIVAKKFRYDVYLNS
ncbi:class I SAM-dependent methyltransferase [Aliikangiella sp. G2MR2-5]|uniref:class I SAM-dependent methyltransferase n=1 Tax=Aliikangiella sp. G2MR2-5 TaxID=2788943 RepID=UPI0018A9EB99|nr:class I SAM-dependent methyltransferase [Aliikangiella sp. G2MR2-5]